MFRLIAGLIAFTLFSPAAFSEPPSERFQFAQSAQQAPQTFQGQLLQQQPQRQDKEADPTALTTLQLQREIQLLREVIETRLDGMDKAIVLLRTELDRNPAMRAEAIEGLQRLLEEKFKSFDEKFRSIGTQFAERDTRTEQTSRDSKVAVDAALQAAKEAVGEQNKSSALAIAKSEASTTKQIDQIVVLINSTTSSLNDKIDDIKQRITTFEGRGEGVANFWGLIVGGIMLLISGIVGVTAVLNRTYPRVVG